VLEEDALQVRSFVSCYLDSDDLRRGAPTIPIRFTQLYLDRDRSLYLLRPSRGSQPIQATLRYYDVIRSSPLFLRNHRRINKGSSSNARGCGVTRVGPLPRARAHAVTFARVEARTIGPTCGFLGAFDRTQPLPPAQRLYAEAYVSPHPACAWTMDRAVRVKPEFATI